MSPLQNGIDFCWLLSLGAERVPISSLLACGRVHHHLVTNKKRMLAGLLLETAEARDTHHMCTLIGYGADAICPYLAMEAIVALQEDGKVDGRASRLDLINNYIKVGDLCLARLMAAPAEWTSPTTTSRLVANAWQG